MWENFGELMFLKLLARKKLANMLALCMAFIFDKAARKGKYWQLARHL